MTLHEEWITQVASAGHELWRSTRWNDQDECYEPRPKTTQDPHWIESHGGVNTVDIANTPYPALPSDWQEENRVMAELAVSGVAEALSRGQSCDRHLVETVSATLHDLWVRRNGDWAPEELKKAYDELPEDEKEKDRFFVKQAIQACQSSPVGA